MELITKYYSLQHDWYRAERRKFFRIQQGLLFFYGNEKFCNMVKEVSENMGKNLKNDYGIN